MKLPAAALLCALLATPWLARPAGATALQGLDLHGLCDRSPQILRGTVESLTPGWHQGRIMTAVRLRVGRTLSGPSRRGDRVIFYRLGGEVGGIGQRVIGEATFRVGEEVVVFLHPRRGRLYLTGMVQGKMRVLPAQRPGDPRRVVSAVGRFALRGVRHPLAVPTTLADLETRVLARMRATKRSTPGARP